MKLKPATQAALDGWVGPQTWDSGHPADMERFYRFVGQYQRDHGLSINESDLRDEIKARVKAKGHPAGPHQENLIHELVNLAYKILDFLRATGR
jgi:hypothetical protein